MKKIILLPIILLSILFSQCDSNADPLKIQAKSHDITVHWFRDATTPDPTAFIDFYRGKAYTLKGAANDTPEINNVLLNAQFIDAFCFDRSSLQVSFQDINFINMSNYATDNFPAADTFHAVVGTASFSTYTTSTFSPAPITTADFNNIQYNEDIASLFASKSLNGGYADMTIAASDLTNNTIAYQFKCSHNGKRGFFVVKSSNYLPGGTMTLSVKVEE